MSRVDLQGIVKRYDNAGDAAVDGVDLSIDNEEFFVLLGPSGCGKSTLLKLVAGLEEPNEGRIFLDDDLVNYVAPSKRNIAMVFQNYALYPQMSVLDNIAFPLRMRGVSRAARREQATRTAESLDLGALLQRSVSQLSGGQRQRVAVARALVRSPRVLLMDEPLSNLDALLRVEMREELLRLHRESATTVMYVTHDQLEATTMADRVAVMSAGRLEQVGPPAEIYGKPANRFVAGFIGSPPMNFVDGRLTRDHGEQFAFEAPGLNVPLPPRLASSLNGAVDVEGGFTLGIRPQDISLAAPDDAPVRGQVQLLESLGSEDIVVIKAGEQVLRAVVRPSERPAVESTVGVRLGAEDMHLFAPDGRTIDA